MSRARAPRTWTSATLQPLRRLLGIIASLSDTPNDDEATRLQKSILLLTTVAITFAAVIWGLFYLAANEAFAALIPLSYAGFSIFDLIVLRRTRRFDRFRFVQTLLVLVLPLGLMLVLGGYANGSVVIVWSFLAPLGALLYWTTRQAALWFALFVASLALAGLLTPLLRAENNLSDVEITAFYVFNLGAVSSIAFVAFLYFVSQKELAMRLLQKNRDLERTNLEQELRLRQSEKLATLGRLSAGVAHELNNPAAAAQRGVSQLRAAITQLLRAEFQLGQRRFSEAQLAALAELQDRALGRDEDGGELDALARGDLEDAIESVLEGAGIDQAWDLSPTLVSMGLDAGAVEELAASLTTEQFTTAIEVLNGTHAAHSLLAEIGEGAGRISEIVAALKTYTYMDQAPVQVLDVHEGLDSTLVMLRGKLGDGVVVRREYAADLPRVQAYGGELNQVWTNLIDNAVDAMDGRGELRLRTSSDETTVVIEIGDDGAGIPEEIRRQIFDPFFTTKAVGQGTGLGLNISHNIVVQRHHGEITVASQPGETTFRVTLPLTLPDV